jgi:aspartyl/asparaginyl beta-hydroxylase (cupin superfamily)
MVMFSLLKPSAHIPPHTGMLNIHYICHLPLIVPPNCSFRVGQQTVEWQEGKMLAFDDSVEHEARNGSGEDRLILIFDVWNPHLSDEEKLLVAKLLELAEDYR